METNKWINIYLTLKKLFTLIVEKKGQKHDQQFLFCPNWSSKNSLPFFVKELLGCYWVNGILSEGLLETLLSIYDFSNWFLRGNAFIGWFNATYWRGSLPNFRNCEVFMVLFPNNLWQVDYLTVFLSKFLLSF